MATPNTIVLKGDFVRDEIVATGAITPGMQVDLDGAVAAAGSVRRCFALENDLIGGGIDDAYAIGDTVQTGVFEPGAEIYALLAHGETTTVGMELEADGSGALIDGSATPIALALEVVANTSGDIARVKVEVL